jgi:hypothetical protein
MDLHQFKATNLHVLQETNLLESLHVTILSFWQASSVDDFVNKGQIGIGLRMTVPWQAPNTPVSASTFQGIDRAFKLTMRYHIDASGNAIDACQSIVILSKWRNPQTPVRRV